MTSSRYLAFALVSLLPSVVDAQDKRPFERSGVSLLEVEVTLERVGDNGAAEPVTPDYRFPAGSRLAFKLDASRGGYASIGVTDKLDPDEVRMLWPQATGGRRQPGHKITAREPTQLPAGGGAPLSLNGAGPTEFVILFSPRAAEDLAPKGRHRRNGRRWLEQIDLRSPIVKRSLKFSGQAANGETLKMRVTVHHGPRIGRP